MSDFIPKVLIFGLSFVRRLHDDLVKGFDSRAKQNFNLAGYFVYVCLKGTGGRTVEKVRKYDISAIASIQPDIIILELGTNDLCHLPPEVVGSRIEELARFFRDELQVKVVVVYQVIDRKIAHSTAPDTAFNAKAAILRQYLCVVLENEVGIFLWEHRDFGSDVNLLSLDGVHCNSQLTRTVSFIPKLSRGDLESPEQTISTIAWFLLFVMNLYLWLWPHFVKDI